MQLAIVKKNPLPMEKHSFILVTSLLPKTDTVWSDFNQLIDKLISLGKIDQNQPLPLVDWMMETGVIIPLQPSETVEIKTPLVNSTERYSLAEIELNIKTALQEPIVMNICTNESIEAFFKEKNIPYEFIKKESKECFMRIFDPDQEDFIKRLCIDRLILLCEPLLVKNKTLRPDGSRTKLQKPIQGNLEKELENFLLKKEIAVFIDHRNNIAHPSGGRFSFNHYFVFTIFLKLIKLFSGVDKTVINNNINF